MAEQHEHEATGEHPAEQAQPVAPAAPLARAAPWLGSAGAGLDHPTAAVARTSSVLGAQRSHGNAWVARALAQREAAAGAEPGAGGAGTAAAPGGLIVEDAQEAQPGQLTRSAFAAQLRPALITTARAALQNPLLALSVEPAVDAWLAGHRDKSAAAIERAIRAEAPGAAAATTAAELVAALCAQVRAAVQEREAGEAGADAPGAAEALAGVAGILFSRRPDAPARSADPLSVQRRLGRGKQLDSSVRARLEPVLGADFADVRVHADGAGAEVSRELGARALAVGRHIAFGAGEYQPGTPVGDALLAHELAHVAQQSSAPAAGGALAAHDAPALERDADASAAGAVAALWLGDAPGAQRLGRSARPRLTGGLSLRRCNGGAKDPGEKAPAEAAPADPKAVYEAKLKEGITILKAADFGRAEAKGRYNREFFTIETDEENSDFSTGVRTDKLVLRKGKWASQAIDATFANPGEWSVDCAEYVQLAELYALRHALGATKFNERVGSISLTIRTHGSTLLDDLVYWNREGRQAPVQRFTTSKGKTSAGAPEPRTMDQLLADAPVGARVMWTNNDAPGSHPWHNENTVKVGPDLYAAHGIHAPDGRKTFSRAEVESGMAREYLTGSKSERKPDASYISAYIYLKQIEVFDTAKGLPGAGAPR